MKRVIRSLSTVALMLGLNPGIAGAGDGVPRTASGRPDLTGNYNAATVTPLQRPERFGDSLYLSKEEAARIEGNMAARIEETSQASDPDREAPPEGGDGSDGGAGNVGGYNFFWLDRGTEAFAVDGRFRTSILIDPPNGRFPPMTESAAKRAAATQAKIVRGDNDGTAFWLESDEPGPFDGPESLLAQERCIVGFTGATPTLPSGYNNYKTIVQTEDHVMILIEMVHDARVVRMKSEGRAVAHLPSEIKKWAGDSIGWWEDDTLVVDTTNFHPEAFLRGGSTQMHVVERFTKLEDGDVLYRFTVDDPSSWTAPWTGEYVLRSTTDRVFEYACHEGNYSMGNILRGARVLEADALGNSGSAPPALEPPVQAAPAASDSPGLRATEKFMETWNARDPDAYASSLNYPHTRPSSWKFDDLRPHRIWQTQDDYVAGVDYARVIATGWERTEVEELRTIHQGDSKAHIAGRWARVDAEGNKTHRNLVTYVATQVDGHWGVQARFHAGTPVEAELQESNAAIAIAKVEEYMTAFNARDPQAWASTLHFPHLRLASGEVVVTETEEEFVANMDFDAFAERFGWDHSAWDEIEAIQVAENAANVALTFSRYNAAGEVISTFNTLYLVTKENEKWGISGRSSFAP